MILPDGYLLVMLAAVVAWLIGALAVSAAFTYGLHAQRTAQKETLQVALLQVQEMQALLSNRDAECARQAAAANENYRTQLALIRADAAAQVADWRRVGLTALDGLKQHAGGAEHLLAATVEQQTVLAQAVTGTTPPPAQGTTE